MSWFADGPRTRTHDIHEIESVVVLHKPNFALIFSCPPDILPKAWQAGVRFSSRKNEHKERSVSIQGLTDRFKSNGLWSMVYSLVCLLLISVTPALSQPLDSIQTLAAESNPGLQAQYKLFEAKMQRVEQAGKIADPQLSFGYFIMPVETRVGPQQAKIGLSQMFPWFGTIEAKEDAAAMAAQAQYQRFLHQKNELYHRVASGYYPLVELNQMIAIEEENRALLMSYKRLLEERLANGKASVVDVLRIDILLEDSKNTSSLLELKLPLLTLELNRILNRPDSIAFRVPDSLAARKNRYMPWSDSLIRQHPLLRAIEQEQASAQSMERVQSKQGLPSFGIGLNYILTGTREGYTGSDNGRDVLLPSVSLSIPVQRSKIKASIREQQLRGESLELQHQELTNQLTSDLMRAQYELNQQAHWTRLYRKQIETLESALRLQLKAYAQDGQSFEEVLRLQQELLRYQKQEIEARTQLWITWSKIEFLTAQYGKE